jgi:mRNA-degrading endonuclease YafQ of YafQ-DinJ toxin-antitoxin module
MNVRWRSQFKKDYKLMMKQGKDIATLDDGERQLLLVRTGSHSDLLE